MKKPFKKIPDTKPSEFYKKIEESLKKIDESKRKFREAIVKADVAQLVAISNDWPINSDRISTIGGTLRLNGYPSEAIEVLRKGIEFNPNHFETWKELSMCQGISESERKLAEEKMRALDPFGFGAD